MPTRRRAARRGMMAFGTFDNFNMVVAGVKGSLAAGIDLIYDTLMVPALDEVSTEYGLLAEAVSHPEDHSSVTYRLRANAKWHDGKPVTAEDVIFSLRRLQEEPSAVLGLLPPRDQGGEDRRARSHLHLRRPRQPRTAADRRPAHRAAQALVGGHRQGRQQARRRRDHARAAARLRRLPASRNSCRPHHRLRARRRLLGQGRQRQHRPRQFRRAAVRVFPRRHRRARGVQGRRDRLAHREQRQELGHRLRLPGGEGQARGARRNFRSAPPAACRASRSTSAGRNSRIRACAAPSTSRSTSRR